MPFIYTNPYRQSYLAAVQELDQRRSQLRAIEQRIQVLEATVSALKPLAEAEDFPPTAENLPQLCCEVLMNSDRPLTALEIRNRLGLMGISIQGSNPMAILHTTLRRLADRTNSDVKLSTDQGNATYEWVGLRPVKPIEEFIAEQQSVQGLEQSRQRRSGNLFTHVPPLGKSGFRKK